MSNVFGILQLLKLVYFSFFFQKIKGYIGFFLQHGVYLTTILCCFTCVTCVSSTWFCGAKPWRRHSCPAADAWHGLAWLGRRPRADPTDTDSAQHPQQTIDCPRGARALLLVPAHGYLPTHTQCLQSTPLPRQFTNRRTGLLRL